MLLTRLGAAVRIQNLTGVHDMKIMFFVTVSWCVGVLISFLLGAALWWVSAVGVIPLVLGMYSGYITGLDVARAESRD